jgi:hypothetical protein
VVGRHLDMYAQEALNGFTCILKQVLTPFNSVVSRLEEVLLREGRQRRESNKLPGALLTKNPNHTRVAHQLFAGQTMGLKVTLHHDTCEWRPTSPVYHTHNDCWELSEACPFRTKTWLSATREQPCSSTTLLCPPHHAHNQDTMP